MIHVIAEAGTNHGGSLEVAKQLINVANNAKADSIKFQHIDPEGLYLPKFYKNGKYEESEVFLERKKGMLNDDEFRRLKNYAQKKQLPMSASVFDKKGIALLDEIDVPYIKIASCDLNNPRLLMEAANTGRTVIVSTGLSTLEEIEQAVKFFLASGNQKLVLMHCVSVYPCHTELINIGFIDTLRSTFGLPVGFSDHTENSIAAVIAVSKGVQWIEKHFTLDRGLKGFDHAYAMEPDMLRDYINDIRTAESACRESLMKVGEFESAVKVRARRGLYAACDIKADETILDKHMLVVRPSAPLCPGDADSIIGKTARRLIHKYEPFDLDLLQ